MMSDLKGGNKWRRFDENLAASHMNLNAARLQRIIQNHAGVADNPARLLLASYQANPASAELAAVHQLQDLLESSLLSNQLQQAARPPIPSHQSWSAVNLNTSQASGDLVAALFSQGANSTPRLPHQPGANHDLASLMARENRHDALATSLTAQSVLALLERSNVQNSLPLPDALFLAEDPLLPLLAGNHGQNNTAASPIQILLNLGELPNEQRRVPVAASPSRNVTTLEVLLQLQSHSTPALTTAPLAAAAAAAAPPSLSFEEWLARALQCTAPNAALNPSLSRDRNNAPGPSSLGVLPGIVLGGKPVAKESGKRKFSAFAPPVRTGSLGLTGHAPEILYLEGDDEALSPYHALARKQIEFFEASEQDISSNARGRNIPIVLGQVGIRCRHCAALHPRQRQRAAMYYPKKLDLLYQACQSLANVHLCEQCQQIPDDIRAELIKLRGEKTTAPVGKKYWADGARIRGIYESEDGMRFRPAPAVADAANM